jgi:hypothetical protein
MQLHIYLLNLGYKTDEVRTRQLGYLGLQKI